MIIYHWCVVRGERRRRCDPARSEGPRTLPRCPRRRARLLLSESVIRGGGDEIAPAPYMSAHGVGVLRNNKVTPLSITSHFVTRCGAGAGVMRSLWDCADRKHEHEPGGDSERAPISVRAQCVYHLLITGAPPIITPIGHEGVIG